MAFRTFGLDEFSRELENMGRLDEFAPELLKAAAPALKETLKEKVKQETRKGYAKGDLAKSIKANKPEKNKKGHYVSVTAKGTDRKGVRNNEKLAYLNYGTSKQEARVVIPAAYREAKEACLEAMQRKYDEVTGR